MKPKFLYHGSSTFVRDVLRPRKAGDASSAANSLAAVYATDRKDIAIGMALNGPKTRAFGDYHERPFRLVVVSGLTRRKYVYAYTLSSEGFKELPRGSHQWVSAGSAPVLKRERFLVKDLGNYWRKATPEEKAWYYETKRSTSARPR